MADARCEKRHDDVDFSWGSKEGRRHTIGTKEGVAERDMQFYESFTYEGVEYHLYDSVYLSGGTEVEPYIGKLIQIYELPNKAREVKVLWFFHPSEISNYLRSGNVLKNEIFLATGCGKGLANVNPLDKSRWMRAGCVPWEERMKEAHDQGTLVLLQNLDPTYTSLEVENIVWCGFGYHCTAKITPHTATSSPHSGQAFAIFKTQVIANKVIGKLGEECLMLPNGRPLVGSSGVLRFPGKQSSFPGHLVIDKVRQQTQRDLREAVSTSHSSQPNTLEYEMALDWGVLQERSDKWWNKLHQIQIEEIEKLKTRLKPN